MRDIIERVLLGILIVPALLFIGLLLLAPFSEWPRWHGSEKLVGLGFSVFFLLCGVALVTILFRKRAPKQPEEKPKYSPWEKTVFGYLFQEAPTAAIAFAVVCTVVSTIMMAQWEGVSRRFPFEQLSQEEWAMTPAVTLIASYIAAMIISALRKAWRFLRRHASKESNGDSSA